MEDRRLYERTQTSFKVVLTHPSIGTIMGTARDISDGGAQVVIDNHALPPVGTVLNVLFKKAVGQVNEKPVPMKIVYAQRNVIGLKFEGR
ncbi:MAG: PilZ domain-containing protein [Pedobacter sp.]|jgi:hypothetical protein|nr:MAG: PilZ domain-containing protein [Pedobacter sp.]